MLQKEIDTMSTHTITTPNRKSFRNSQVPARTQRAMQSVAKKVAAAQKAEAEQARLAERKQLLANCGGTYISPKVLFNARIQGVKAARHMQILTNLIAQVERMQIERDKTYGPVAIEELADICERYAHTPEITGTTTQFLHQELIARKEEAEALLEWSEEVAEAA